MPEKIIISEKLYRELIDYCRKNPEKESCGIFAGKGKRIEKFFPLKNISESPKLCYLIDAKEQLGIFKQIRSEGSEFTAIFHSHINSPAYPSVKDLELAFYPDSSYIIVSLNDKVPVRSFRIMEGKITEEEIEII